MVKRVYYNINEDMAKASNDANSTFDYSYGTATRGYKAHVDRVYDIVDRIAEEKPDQLEKAEAMAERYSRRLAKYYNSWYRNEASCPSILISGAGNFPVKKKEKQNQRRDTLFQEEQEISNYAEKIEHLLTKNQPILSNDEQAIEKLESKLENLRQKQEDMKAANAYYRKHKTLQGCPGLSDQAIAVVEKNWRDGWYPGKVFPPYSLQNNNQKIHATEARLNQLKAMKSSKSTEVKYDGFKVIENTGAVRLQFVFDGKPDEDVRDILESNGFRWSPKNQAWQRQLTSNAKAAGQRVVEQMGLDVKIPEIVLEVEQE